MSPTKEQHTKGLCIEFVADTFCANPRIQYGVFCQQHHERDVARHRKWIEHCERSGPQPPGTSHITLRESFCDDVLDAEFITEE